MKLTFIQRFFSYLTFFTLFFSGIFWLYYSLNDYSSLPEMVLSLQLHGAAAFGFLIVFGMILSTHISFNWQVKKNRRKSGLILVALLVILIFSGYCLYYIGNEEIRDLTSDAHWLVGIISTIIFTWHGFTKIAEKKSLKKR